MNRRELDALDRHITGNWGEDQLRTFCADCGEECDFDAVGEKLEINPLDIETCLPCYLKREENALENAIYWEGEPR
jgi:MinD superfamily P-loop ATPase